MPHTIRFDNLSPAVKKVLPEGERELTEEFERFAAHYGFSYEFCNPNSGNEKGYVEAMVKYIRNNYLLPAVLYNRLADLNEQAFAWSVGDRKRAQYEKELPISELHLADKEQLLQLLGNAYECIRYKHLKVDKYGFIRIDRKQYSTSPRFAGQAVTAKLSFDQVTILNEKNEILITNPRLYGNERKAMNWQPYLTLMAKRPMALKYSSFYDQQPEELKLYFEACSLEEKKAALSLLAVLLKEQVFDLPTEALRMASEHGHPTAESIKHVYYQLVNGRGIRETLSLSRLPQKLPMAEPASRGLNHYDQLFAMAGGEQS